MPFPHEAVLGFNFFSALVDAFPYHSWPSATCDMGKLLHVEKAFSNVAINKLGFLLRNFSFKLQYAE